MRSFFYKLTTNYFTMKIMKRQTFSDDLHIHFAITPLLLIGLDTGSHAQYNEPVKRIHLRGSAPMDQEKAYADTQAKPNQGRWKRFLVLVLVVCVLAAPFAKRTYRKLSNLYEDFAQRWSVMNQVWARANRTKHPPIELTEEMRDGVLY